MSAQTVAVDKARDANSRANGRPRSSRGLFRLVHRGVALLVFIGLWQLACQAKLHLLINFGNVPGPIAVAEAFIGFVQSPDAARHIGSSLIRIFSGFGLGAILAVPIGIWVARSRAGRRHPPHPSGNAPANSGGGLDSIVHSHVRHCRTKYDLHLLHWRILSDPAEHDSRSQRH